jgi:hypothetical protein
MRFPITFVSLFISAVTVRADFHILGQQGNVLGFGENALTQQTDQLIACPSNQFNCECFANQRGGVEATETGSNLEISLPGVPFPTRGFFSLKSGLCGARQLNLFRKEDGQTWDVFEDGGDGRAVATCSPTNSLNECQVSFDVRVAAFDLLICTSFLCT